MNQESIIKVQERIGTKPDGDFGPKSRAALQAHLRSLMPNPHPWPSDNEVALTRFFGKAGDESNLVDLPVIGLGVRYDGKPIRSIRCHRKVADSLLEIIADIASGPHAAILSEYAGCFNYRKSRGGSRMSAHAWGVAIDLDPDPNGNLTPWPKAATMTLDVMEVFARRGWMSAGAFWGRDAMHFSATK